VSAANADTSILNVLVPRTASIRAFCRPDKTQPYPQKIRNVWINPEFRKSTCNWESDRITGQNTRVAVCSKVPGTHYYSTLVRGTWYLVLVPVVSILRGQWG
jgi:hypothetical protein